jgi:phospholipid/cholesterol/gamma-HCH transport system substrate-binding protein
MGGDAMRLTRRVVINTIAFLVLGFLLVLMLAVQVLPTVFGSTYSVYGIFTASGGVAPNQEVTYRGVQVGRVGEMTLTKEAVRIEMQIESGFKIPKEGTRARVLFKSAVGEQFIDILPERDEGPFFQKGDVIPVSMTSIPIQIEDLLRELDAVLVSIDPKALGQLIHELGTGLKDRGEDLREIIKGFDVFTRIGADNLGELIGILRDGADLQDSFNASSEEFVRAVQALRTVAGVLAARRGDLERTLNATSGLNTEIIKLLDSRRRELEQILGDLGTTVRTTHAHRSDLDKLLTYLGPFLGDTTLAFDAPYYVFNLVTNTENPACVYDPSSRPARAVTETDATTPDEPIHDFACPGETTSVSSRSIAELPEPVRNQLEQISWLQLFTLGY